MVLVWVWWNATPFGTLYYNQTVAQGDSHIILEVPKDGSGIFCFTQDIHFCWFVISSECKHTRCTTLSIAWCISDTIIQCLGFLHALILISFL